MEKYDFLVIGSGYGGAVASYYLSGKGKTLLVEKGRHWKEGEFPETLWGIASLFQKNSLGRQLFGLRIGKGIGVAYAQALGGASVVNYGITIEPPAHVFQDWPISYEDIRPFYDQVRGGLMPASHPKWSQFDEASYLDRIEPGSQIALENTIDWEKCMDCGHCVPGCNYGAKRSLNQTYLSLAREKGLTVYENTEALNIERRNGHYHVYLRNHKPYKSGRLGQWVSCNKVFLAAGTFGTLEFLYRHRRSMPLGPLFGKRMSMNGDGLAILYNTPFPQSSHLGAPVTTHARLMDHSGKKPKVLTVMSGRVPLSILRHSAFAMAFLSPIVGKKLYLKESLFSYYKRWLSDLLLLHPARGALGHTFLFKLDGQDQSRAVCRFDRMGRAYMDWPDYLQDPIFEFAHSKLEEWAKKGGGRIIPNLGSLPFMKSFGVHPLGGCAMGESIHTGVVDPLGRPFRPNGGVYPDFHIVDASILPASLGVPPSMTIAANTARILSALEL